MRRIIPLSLVLFCLFWGPGLARAAQPTLSAVAAANYDATKTYSGRFVKDRLYQQQYGTHFWLPARNPKTLEDVTCPSVKLTLSLHGTWTGFIRNGICDETVEGRPWVTGNYLNFQSTATGE